MIEAIQQSECVNDFLNEIVHAHRHRSMFTSSTKLLLSQ